MTSLLRSGSDDVMNDCGATYECGISPPSPKCFVLVATPFVCERVVSSSFGTFRSAVVSTCARPFRWPSGPACAPSPFRRAVVSCVGDRSGVLSPVHPTHSGTRPSSSVAGSPFVGAGAPSAPPLHSLLRTPPARGCSLVVAALFVSSRSPGSRGTRATCGWFLRCSFARGGDATATAVRRRSRGRDESRPWSRRRAFAPYGRSGRNGRAPSSRSW